MFHNLMASINNFNSISAICMCDISSEWTILHLYDVAMHDKITLISHSNRLKGTGLCLCIVDVITWTDFVTI